jgi:hypothetical protein
MTEPGAAPGGASWSATLWRRSLWLVLSLAALALIVVPLIQELPLGQTTRTSMLAWLMVGVAFYWLYAGFGVRPLLLLQLLLFSTAAALLTAKLLLVGIGINRLGLLRRIARVLIMMGAATAAFNLLSMLWAIVRRAPPADSARG